VRHIKYNTTIRLGRSVLQLMVSHYSPTTARIDIAIIIQMIINMNFVTGNENQSQRSAMKGLMIHTHTHTHTQSVVVYSNIIRIKVKVRRLHSVRGIYIGIHLHCAMFDETLQNKIYIIL